MTMTLDIPPLLDLARAGDEQAIGQLLSSFESYLLLLARVRLGPKLRGKVDPGDIVQEVFLDATRQFPNFRGTHEAELSVWLRRILAGQLALTMRRFLGSKGRDVRLERDIQQQIDDSARALDAGLAASLSTPSQHASKREQTVLLADAMAKLPEDYREVIILRHLEGLGFAEVASRMGRSEDSVQKLWVRSLAKLRTTLSTEGN
ncbi:MAG: rpoE 4 [Phycisphaerales bacterium]|nr:rpoE 4 [Phycisphaerales bacterium]